MKMNINYPDQIAALHREVLRLNIALHGKKHGLHDGAEIDVLDRVHAEYTVDPDRAVPVSRTGQPLEHRIEELAKDHRTRHLFGQKEEKPADTLSAAELAKMSPMQRLEYANAQLHPTKAQK